MNKLIFMFLFLASFLSAGNIYADGFEGEKSKDIQIEDWQCEYCPSSEKWTGKIETHLGLLDDNIFHFGNYSGIEDDSQLFLSGDVKMLDNERYWNSSFQNLGLKSMGIQTEYGISGIYELSLEFQNIPVRKYDQLDTPFVNPGANSLLLSNDWIVSDDARDYAASDLFSQFSLGTDWDIFKLNLDFSGSNNFDYSTSYRRLKKEGIKEFSATQILNATFLPFPVNQTTEDFDAAISYSAEQWFTKLGAKISRFNNEVNAVGYQLPYISLVNGSEMGNLSAAPDNTFTNMSLYTRYKYAPRSFVKINYSMGKLTQDEQFLPATTNPDLQVPLPQMSLDGKVTSENLSLQLRHWIDDQWSLGLKYRYRNRDNDSEQLVFQPVVTDVIIGSSLTNLPYDFSKKTGSVQLDYQFYKNQKVSLNYRSEERTRNFQSVYKTNNDGFSVKYNATFFESLQLNVAAEQLSRDSSEPQLIDFLGVTENPLMQRFNVADREQDKFDFQLYYSFSESISAAISAHYIEQDYHKSQIGLINNQQDNINLDLYWLLNENANFTIYFQKEDIETKLTGSDGFSVADWQADNLDEVTSYGVNFSFKELLDNNLNLFLDFARSDANSRTIIAQANNLDTLPNISSLWSNAEFKMDYQYSEKTNLALSFQYQKFENSDFAIDGVLPGSLTNLLTFGAFSNNYDVKYLILSVSYKL